MKKLIIFDLDGTIAESKAPIDAEMAALLHALLARTGVAVISGGDWPQFEKQVLARLPHDAALERLSILPTCGTKFYRFVRDEDGGGAWRKLYSEDFTAEEKDLIIRSLGDVLTETGFGAAETWGEVIEDRGSQITLSALGQQAPNDAKKSWDPDFSKRQKMKALLADRIPGFAVNLGGMTSVDVTKPGIDKGYGVRKMRDVLGIAIPDMLFVGDALFPGGNDYPAKEAGVESVQVSGVAEAKRVIEGLFKE
jgi:HAD superfamily hydrolase (TIGR01484 family)